MDDEETWGRAGYVTDVAYTSGYYNELAPAEIDYVATLRGFAPPAREDGFDYCELGCGNGMSSNVLAAANPEGRFVAVDLNPEHIASARALAEAGGLTNIRFLEQDFASLLETDLPQFDYITLHGVYTWVGPEERAQIGQLIAHRLRPGGLVYVSYNAMPGWAGLAPLRAMMLAYGEGIAADSLEQARQGLAYLRFLCERGARFFTDNPSARHYLERLERADLRYVVHEFFNAHWAPLYFSQVARAMREIGLEFAGSLPVVLNYADLCLPANVQEVFATAPDRYTFEVHKDLVRNERFRRDLYVRPALPGRAPRPEDFAATCFGTALPREAISLQAVVPAGRVTLSGERYEALIERIATRGPCRLAELEGDPGLGWETPAALVGAVQRLVVTGQFHPARRPAAPSRPASGGLEASSAFNRALLERAVAGHGSAVLASVPFGSGLTVPFNEALMLLAIDRAGLDGAPAWAEEALIREGGRVVDAEGRPLEDPAVLRGALASLRDAFAGELGERFQRLGLAVAA